MLRQDTFQKAGHVLKFAKSNEESSWYQNGTVIIAMMVSEDEFSCRVLELIHLTAATPQPQ